MMKLKDLKTIVDLLHDVNPEAEVETGYEAILFLSIPNTLSDTQISCLEELSCFQCDETESIFECDV
jgi:hypothetical protein